MEGGLAYYRAAVLRELDRAEEARASFVEFIDRLPVDFRPQTDDASVDTEFGG